LIIIGSVFALLAVGAWALAEGKDTAKAATTRKKLQEKVTVDFQDESISNVVEELKKQIPSLGIKIDTVGGVSRNLKITYKADKQPLADVLEGMFKSKDLGYVVVSKQGNAYDGTLLIKKGNERGYEVGDEAEEAAPKTKDKTTKTVGKLKAKPKEKDDEKAAAKEKLPEDDAQKAEADAARKLKFAQTLAEDGKTAKAKERLEDIIAKYPKTKAAEEARALLKTLDK
jgi:TolA-binding protein